MKILITGATGFVGKRLTRRLINEGHSLVIVSRNADSARLTLNFPCDIFSWNSNTEDFPQLALTGVNAVINLAGESISHGRWSKAKLKAIYDSRVMTTQKLVKAINKITEKKPMTFISTSAVGFYGDRGDESLNEESKPGNDFLSHVCQDWEKAALSVSDHVRTVILRLGVVLGHNEGALPQMTLPFRLGVGATIGSGQQWLSWIHIDDLISLFIWLLENNKMSGPVNAVSPQPITNRDFSVQLAKMLNVPLFLSAPGFMIKLLLGEKASLLLTSQRVNPEQALNHHFSFQFKSAEEALRNLLDQSNFN